MNISPIYKQTGYQRKEQEAEKEERRERKIDIDVSCEFALILNDSIL